MRQKKETILAKLYGRIYVVFCIQCGKTAMDETKELNRVVCSYCGGINFSIIRDIALETQLMAKADKVSIQ
jgi:Zn finger protein HypA/HybF involved in hydrogenase expression